MSADLKGKVALVTGSSSGIGAAVAATFADLGAGVVVNSSSSVVDGQQVAAGLPDAIYVQADVSDPDQAATLVAAAVDHYGRLDIVVNNAGTTAVIPHHDLDAATNEIWERILRVNVLGTWNVIHSATAHLRASGDGIILNITSVAGVRPARLIDPVRGLEGRAQPSHRAARQRARSRDPRARGRARADRHTVDGRLGRRPRRRSGEERRCGGSGTPDDVADACVALVGARYATGQVLVLDGGLALT